MLRVLIALLWIGVTIYALADWWRTPEEHCPGRIPKALWLLLLLVTIPSFSIGSVAWVILRAVGRAEARQKGETVDDTGLFRAVKERVAPPPPPPAPTRVAPDDDPEFLFRLERELARKRAEERAAAQKAERERHARERGHVQDSSSSALTEKKDPVDTEHGGDARSAEGESTPNDTPPHGEHTDTSGT